MFSEAFFWKATIPTTLSKARINRVCVSRLYSVMAAPKRKRSTNLSSAAGVAKDQTPPLTKRRASGRNISSTSLLDPEQNPEVIDAPSATRASPDSDINESIIPGKVKREHSESPLSDVPEVETNGAGKKRGRKPAAENSVGKPSKAKTAPGPKSTQSDEVTKKQVPKTGKKDDAESYDPEADGEEEAGEEEVKEASLRPRPVNSEYLPLPWKGRLGYACLNTYLRNSNPPVFSSRTCRIQSILEHRHPLANPNEPEHPTKNRPDRSKPASVKLGQQYVENLCLANVRDIAKMIRWNDRYNIKFLRLSSEMFPFASHSEYGYKLAPFAADALAEAGKVISELGHRVSTHPGQFTQLGSPRQQVIDTAIRDLEYHDEMLTLLKLPVQQDRDAVMILHMGGMFESKEATVQRFKENYANLTQSIKNRLVLENCDMGWSVHDLLPVCEELNIPLVLDFHHHNIVFDADQIREGTKDIMDLFPRIKATWDRKGIKQKMHYSEPTPQAITRTQRRKHNPRPFTLPPCAPDMDLMIEAKDKEQAVFELMRNFKLPGYDTINDIVPYTRFDDNKAALATMAKKKKNPDEPEPEMIPEDQVGMGGPEGRVYWPPGMEEWLRPRKREVKKKDTTEKSKEQIKKEAAAAYAARQAALKAEQEDEDVESDLDATPATKKAKAAMRKKQRADAEKAASKAAEAEAKLAAKSTPKGGATSGRKKKAVVKKEPQAVPTPSDSEAFDEDLDLDDDEDDLAPWTPVPQRASNGRRGAGRSAKGRVSYREADDAAEES